MTALYGVDLDSNRHPVLVRETEVDYAASRVECSATAVEILNSCFHADRKAEEFVFMAALDARKDVLGLFSVAHGQADSCGISPREIFLRALLSGAASVVVAHNHPSGDASPSSCDDEFTQRVREAGNTLGIEIDDSIVIGRAGTYYSYRDSGRL